MPGDAAVVQLTMTDQIGVLRLHNPARRNALTAAVLGELIAGLAACRTAGMRAVVLRAGPDDPVWSAGFDIAALADGSDPLHPDGLLQRAFRAIADCPAPVIAMLHGSCWGGGCDLALRCDIVIGDATASFAFTPARLGLAYDPDGLRNVLLRAGRTLAMEMFATAAPVPATRALQAGLLNHLVAESELEPFTMAMARQIAANAPLAVAAAKAQLNALAAALHLPEDVAARMAQLRAEAFASADYREGQAAFHARRKPDFSGE